MNLDNEFDELARRKLQEQAFPFEETHWLEMQKTLNGGRKRRAGGFWIIGSAALLLIGISSWWLLQDTSSAGHVAEMGEKRSGNAPMHARSATQGQPVTTGPEIDPSTGTAITTDTATEAPVTDHASITTTVHSNNNTNGRSDNRITSSNSSAGAARRSENATRAVEASTGQTTGPADGRSAEQPDVRTPKASMGTNDAVANGDEMTDREDRTNDHGLNIASAAIPTGTAAGTTTDERTSMNVSTVPEGVGPQTNEEGNEYSTVGTEEQAAGISLADSSVADTAMASKTLPTPADSAATTALPASLPPLIPERAPWEISALGGIFSSTSAYSGGRSAEWAQDVSRVTTSGFGAEMMHMGRNIGIGMGLHYGTYAERITFGELSTTTVEIDNFWYLTPVDTTILFISDTINAGTDSSIYVGQSIPATINVLAQGSDTTTTTSVTRKARELVNRTSYLEIHLLFDVHVVQGRWSLGLRGGPTVGFLTGRTGALPNATDDGYTEFGDQAFREVMVGYTARAYIRYRWNAAWSIGLEPAIRGQLMNSLGDGAIDRRSTALGGMISLSYRLR